MGDSTDSRVKIHQTGHAGLEARLHSINWLKQQRFRLNCPGAYDRRKGVQHS